jgi:hypothetical protein
MGIEEGRTELCVGQGPQCICMMYVGGGSRVAIVGPGVNVGVGCPGS